MPKCRSSASPTRCGGLPRHARDAEIDVRLAELDRQQLRVAVGEMQQVHVAEARQVVEARRVLRASAPGELRQGQAAAAASRPSHAGTRAGSRADAARYLLTGEFGSSSSATRSLICCLGERSEMAEARHVRTQVECLGVVDLAVHVLLHLRRRSRGSCRTGTGCCRWCRRTSRSARSGGSCSSCRRWLWPALSLQVMPRAVLRDLLARFPVAQELAVRRILDRLELVAAAGARRSALGGLLSLRLHTRLQCRPRSAGPCRRCLWRGNPASSWRWPWRGRPAPAR